MKILIVDDNPDICEILEVQLESELDGLEIVTALSGIKALEMLGDGLNPDIILTDYNMPKMNGSEFALKVLEINPISSIFLISGHAKMLAQLEKTPIHFHHIFDKPIDYDLLREKVKQYPLSEYRNIPGCFAFQLQNLNFERPLSFNLYVIGDDGELELVAHKGSSISKDQASSLCAADPCIGYIMREDYDELDRAEYLPVRVSTLRSNEKVNFSIFHHDPSGDFRVLMGEGTTIGPQHLEIFKKSKIKKVFIRESDEVHYEKYLDKILDQIISAPDVDDVEKAHVVDQYIGSKVGKVFENISQESLDSLKSVGSTIRKYIDEQGANGVYNILKLQDGTPMQRHASNVSFLCASIYEEIIRLRSDEKLSQITKPFDNLIFADNEETKDELILSGLLHDIGELPGVIDQYEFLEQGMHHAVSGSMILREMKQAPAVVQTVADHQERCDGSGGPRKVFKGSLSILTQILSLADHIEEEISLHSKEVPQVMEELDQSGSKFNKFLIPIIKNIFK